MSSAVRKGQDTMVQVELALNLPLLTSSAPLKLRTRGWFICICFAFLANASGSVWSFLGFDSGRNSSGTQQETRSKACSQFAVAGNSWELPGACRAL